MARQRPTVRLIATDLDGTLLRSDGTVSARTSRALARAAAAGIDVVMVTGRPARHVRALAGSAHLGAVAICINGALTYSLPQDAILSESRLSADTARALVATLRARLPEVSFAVEVGLRYGWDEEYARHRGKIDPPDLPVSDAMTLCADGANKLIAFHPELSGAEVLDRAHDLIADLAAASFSGAPFLEIGPRAVSKASALAAYCAERDIAAADVIAIGDMPNDLPMLAWSGRSVAVANAHREVLAFAEERTLSNDEDGVAELVERLLEPAGLHTR